MTKEEELRNAYIEVMEENIQLRGEIERLRDELCRRTTSRLATKRLCGGDARHGYAERAEAEGFTPD